MQCFRDGSQLCSPAVLAAQLCAALPRLGKASPGAVVDALLRAGELECGLADAGDLASCASVATVTDALAAMLVGRCDAHPSLPPSIAALQRLVLPETIRVSPPEGFCYYALHPASYAANVEQIAGVNAVAVVGIRSIGTTLSAVVHAAARARGMQSERITVRPTGHPFDRQLQFSEAQADWVRRHGDRGATLLIVDEGPGLSGSSLLAVADALAACGIARDRIVLLCSYEPDLAALRAPRAAERWRQHRWIPAPPSQLRPETAGEDFSGGQWRSRLLSDPSEWPATWTQTERLKYLSRDRKRLFKFDGFGRFGAAVLERALAAAAAGFSPPVEAAEHGFSASEFVDGHLLRPHDLDAALLEWLARYCAFRAELAVPAASLDGLRDLARQNVEEEFGIVLDLPQFEIVRPVIADARMLPHEFVAARDGRIYKTDAASHGDDHFFPGPTDIAWDLAGAIVEWNMPAGAAEALVGRYQQISGDRAAARLPFFLVAYAAFRLGFCRMAAHASEPGDAQRLNRAADRYRDALALHLKRLRGKPVAA